MKAQIRIARALMAVANALLLNERGDRNAGQQGFCCNGAGLSKGFQKGDVLWLPSRDGVVALDTHEIVKNRMPPALVIERVRRPGERDGVDYHFLSDADFQRRVDAGDFVEHAVYYRRDGSNFWRAGTAAFGTPQWRAPAPTSRSASSSTPSSRPSSCAARASSPLA